MILAKKVNYEIIFKSNSTRELFDKLESVAWEFVEKLAVIPKYFYKKSLSHKWGKVPMGYFLTHNGNRVTIFKKELRTGYVYNTCGVTKIISFLLILPKKNKYNFLESKNYLEKAQCKVSDFSEVHELIRARNVKEN